MFEEIKDDIELLDRLETGDVIVTTKAVWEKLLEYSNSNGMPSCNSRFYGYPIEVALDEKQAREKASEIGKEKKVVLVLE